MNHINPEVYSRAYNNRLLVPHFKDILRLWDEESVKARQILHTSRRAHWDVAYGPDALHKLDVFEAGGNAESAGKGAPILFFIHGGYWRMLDKSAQSFIAPTWSARGAMVVIPNYRLAPKVTLGEISLDIVQAVAWVWRNAARFGGDRERIVVAGHSAGGHLTTMALSCLWNRLAADLPPAMVKKGLAISGLFDLEPLQHCEWLQPDIQLNPQRVASWSPARWKAPSNCRVVAVAGALESGEFHRQMQVLHKAWGPKVVEAVVSVAGRNHFDILLDLLDPHTALSVQLARLLGVQA